MNFKTTIILLFVLVAVGVTLFATRDIKPREETVTEQKLLDITSADVTRVAFTSDDGTTIALEKTNGTWQLTEPVKAPAEEFAVSGLVDALVALQSRGQVDAGPATGLDAPRYKVQIATRGRTIKLDVGSRSVVGDNLYVKREGQSRADVVPASVYTQLEKPLKDFRRARLFDIPADSIKQIRVATTQQSLAVQKEGEEWRITEPQNMPGDSSAISSMTFALTGLRAEDFVTQATSDVSRFGLDQPVMTVAFSADEPVLPPATQPTTQPTFTTVKFGRFEDVLKKSVYASISGEPVTIVKVPATVLDSFRKTPLELRDKKVVTIDPENVTKISINVDKPATTQPTTREAFSSTVVLERTKQQMGPAEPTPATAPTTAPTTDEAEALADAATQPTAEPVEPADPPSKWNLASSSGVDADDTKVDDLLRELNPLRADRFHETAPTTEPIGTITLAVETTDARHEIRFIDGGDGQPITAAYNGLSFEVPRFVLEKFEADFAKTTPATTIE